MPAFFIAAWLAVMGMMFCYKDGPKHDHGFFDTTSSEKGK